MTRPYLTIFAEGSASVFQFPKDGIYVLGRAPDAEVQVGDPAASRRHAQVQIEGDSALLSDLGSANGTRLNGQSLRGAMPLLAGSVIGIGATEIVFHWRVPRQTCQNILNGISFQQLVIAEVERSLRHAHPLTLLLIDIDENVKRGDAALQVISKAARRMDRIGKLNESTLAVLFPELGAADARTACERILGETGRLIGTVRGGAAHWPDDGYDMETLLAAARAALEQAAPGAVLSAGQTALHLRFGGQNIALADPALLRLMALAKRLASSDLPVLIGGEPGVGKELFATAIHELSPRAAAPLVTISCAALPESRVESELFGHSRGAFPGALDHRVGQLEAAHGGTVFFDEVGDLPLPIQAQLLRVLENRTVTRMGETESRSVDLRVVAATNRDLRQRIAEASFLQALFFRLSGATLHVPPLRERPRDIALISRTILADLAGPERAALSISPEAMGLLASYSWPGNVRELRNALRHAATVVVGTVIETWMLPPEISGCSQEVLTQAAGLDGEQSFRPIEEELQEIEIRRIKEALAAAGGVQTRAAALISLPWRTFQAKCAKYGLGTRPGRDQRRTGSVPEAIPSPRPKSEG